MRILERLDRLPTWVLVTSLAIIFLTLTFVAFGAALWHDFAPVDDWFLIMQNLAVRGVTWDHIRTVFTSYDPELYIPFVFLSFQLNYLFGGLHPFGYHLVNLLLHAANAGLVSWLLLILTRNRLLAILGGLLFAVHPLQTEAVVWVAGRKDLLATFFSLLTIILYLRYREQGSRPSYIASVVFLLCALLSTAVAMSSSGVLILCDLCLERRKMDRKFFVDKLPHILLAIVFIAVAIGGKQRVIGDSSMGETILIAAKSTTFYLEKIFWPTGLTVTYMQTEPIRLLTPDLLIRVVITLSLLSATVWALLKKPWIAFGPLFYLVTLAPTFLNARKGGTVFFAVDRYAYLPMVGILALAAALATPLCLKNQKRIAAGGLLMMIIMIILARRQTDTWATPETLYVHAQEVNPEAVMTYIDLAELYRKKKDFDAATHYIQEGMRVGDSIFLHLSAGRLKANEGEIAAAIEEFQKAQAMDPKNPEPLFSLGSIAEQRGDAAHAEEYYQKAADLDASYVAAFVKLADFALRRGDLDRAEALYTHALTWNPSSDAANRGMGNLLLEKGQPDAARERFGNVIALDPYDTDALLALAKIALAEGKKEEATSYAERILRQDQRNEEAKKILQEIGP